MLTPTDIHILVGLLTKVTSPDDIEIILGDLVYDVGAGKRRDVDVTVTYKDTNGIVSAFKGIEVKKHKRPLDVTHVEQLCIKLKDMSDISHKAIVSASGYTQPARKKAEAHGVDLYSFIPWSNRIEGFGHAQFAPNFVFEQRVLSWASSPSVTFQLENSNQNVEINKDSPICNVAGKEINLKTIQQLGDRLCLLAIQQLVNNKEIKKASPGVENSARVLFNDLNNICIDLKGSQKQLKQALVKGMVVWKEHSLPLELKILVKDGELKPYVGCAIAELLQGNLVGFTVSQVNRNLNLINIPVSARNIKKIQTLQLK